MKLDAKWQVLIIVSIGIFMSTLDGSILNIANPTIAKEMSVTMQQIQWVVTAYMLVITASLLFFGKLGDILGSTRVYAFGFLMFTLGSFFCSISSSLSLLICSRIFQALGASMLMATGMGIVSNTFPANERGKALGLTGSIVGIGNMTGPSLGGLLVAKFSWPVIFLINIPIGLAGFYFAYRYFPSMPRSTEKTKFDIPGIVLFALASVILVIALSTGKGIDFRLASLGFVLFIMFYLFEKKSPHSMLDFALFKVRNFSYGNLMGLAAYSAQTSVFFLMPFYMENLLHFSPSLSGLMMTIPPVSMAITAPLSGSLSDRIGNSRITPISFLLMIGAYLVLSTLDQNINMYKIIGGLILMGIGMGTFGSPNNSSILGSIPREKAGYAGGFISTVRNFSFSLGIAASVSIFSYFLSINQEKTNYTMAYAGATSSVYRIAAAIALIGLILSLLAERKSAPEQKSAEPL